MGEPKRLVAHLPSREISVYQLGEELQIDYPDIAGETVAEEAMQFVLHLMESDADGLARIRASGDWRELDAAFAEWHRRIGLS